MFTDPVTNLEITRAFASVVVKMYFFYGSGVDFISLSIYTQLIVEGFLFPDHMRYAGSLNVNCGR